MQPQFVKIQNAFFKRDQNGQLQAVGDRETLSALKAGQIKYTSEATTRSLKFADEISSGGGDIAAPSNNPEAPASTSLTQGTDVNQVFKDTFMRTLQGLNNPNLKKLQARKENIRTEALLAPADLTGLAPGDAIRQVTNKGAEYSDAIKSIDDAIAKENYASAEDLKKLQTVSELLKSLNPSSEGTSDIKNYEYAKSQGYTGSFEQWQTDDANRKRSVVNNVDMSGMTTKQQTLFSSIVDKYNKSPLIAASDRTGPLRTITEQLKKDPKNASLQVSFIYSFIQALDTYQSAVREGEIGFISSTQGLADQIRNLPDQIAQGTVLSTNVLNKYLTTATTLADSIGSAAKQKEASFKSQADTLGIGDSWDEYRAGFSASYDKPKTAATEKVLMINAQGQRGYVPAAQAEAALKQGYKYAQ